MPHQLFADPPLGNPPGVRGDERDLDRLLEEVEREGGVAFAVHAVVPHVHAVVAGEDDQRPLPQSVRFKPVEQAADVAVHGGDGGEVAAERFAPRRLRTDRDVERSDPGGGRQTVGERRERAVAEIAVVQFGGVLVALPGRMRGRVVDAQVKRRGVAAARVDPVQRVVGEDVGDVARFLDHAVAADHRCAVVRPASLGVDGPVFEPLLRVVGVAHVPFAAEAAAVAGRRQQVGVAGLIRQVLDPLAAAGRFVFRERVAGGKPVVDAVLRRDAPRQEGGSGGGADGAGAEEIREPVPRRRQTVEVRCLDFGVARAAHRPGAMVVGENEEDVGAFRFRRGHGRTSIAGGQRSAKSAFLAFRRHASALGKSSKERSGASRAPSRGTPSVCSSAYSCRLSAKASQRSESIGPSGPG